jgi:ankyrin repeat protein
MVACMRGFIRIAKILLDRGAEHNTQCQLNGYSALMFASNGSTKKLLPSAGSSESTDPQEPAANKIEIVELLLSYGTDLTLCNWLGLTAVDIASDTGQKDVFELLSARIKTKSAARNRRTASTSGKGAAMTNATPFIMTSMNSSGEDELGNSSDKDRFGRLAKGKKQSDRFDEVQPAQFTQPSRLNSHKQREKDDGKTSVDEFGHHISGNSPV